MLALTGKALPFQGLCLHVYSKQALWGKKWNFKSQSLFHSATAHGRFAAQFLLTMIFSLMIKLYLMHSLKWSEKLYEQLSVAFHGRTCLSWWALLVQETAWHYNSSRIHIHSGAKRRCDSATKLPFNSVFLHSTSTDEDGMWDRSGVCEFTIQVSIIHNII